MTLRPAFRPRRSSGSRVGRSSSASVEFLDEGVHVGGEPAVVLEEEAVAESG